MENTTRYLGVNFTTLRKALYLLFFGVDNGNCNNLDSPKYKYIMYWIERDESLTQDDYEEYDDTGWNRQKCVASILVRFIGKEAEQWVKAFRHLTKRSGVTDIWAGVCNAEKLEYTSPVVPRKINYFGMNSQIAFDVRFKLYYDEVVSTGWKPLEGIDMTIKGELTVED